MEEAIWSSPRDVRRALARLGLTLEIMRDVVQAGYLSRSTRTENDPPNAAGTYQWVDTVRAAREHCVAMGWTRSNEDGIPAAINPAGDVALVVSSGNDATGIVGKTPSTKYHKGPGTVELVTSNAELMFDFVEVAPVAPSRRAEGVATWTLLFFTAEDEVRSELSLPILIDGSGQINGWRERIILPAIRLDGDDGSKRSPEPDFGPDVDIEIRRRA
jgi:hypothetical protein